MNYPPMTLNVQDRGTKIKHNNFCEDKLEQSTLFSFTLQLSQRIRKGWTDQAWKCETKHALYQIGQY